MLPLIFHPEAATEACIAADWYELQQPGLGKRFEEDLQRTAQLVQENPLLFAVEKLNERFASLRNFAYSLIYKIDREQIWVA